MRQGATNPATHWGFGGLKHGEERLTLTALIINEVEEQSFILTVQDIAADLQSQLPTTDTMTVHDRSMTADDYYQTVSGNPAAWTDPWARGPGKCIL